MKPVYDFFPEIFCLKNLGLDPSPSGTRQQKTLNPNPVSNECDPKHQELPAKAFKLAALRPQKRVTGRIFGIIK
jgi:hypothetical protein